MNIEPIKLLTGAHDDTGKTGSGCFMNVIAYLNGEAQITDSSPCVCVTVRPLAIKLNDLGNEEQRQRLLPFVLRAMGSATQDPEILQIRAARLRQYGAEGEKILRAWRKKMKAPQAHAYVNAYVDANDNAYAYFKFYAYAYAAADAYAYAYSVAYENATPIAIAYADGAKNQLGEVREALFDAGLRYLDAVLPKIDSIAPEVEERAVCLVELFKKHNPEFA